MSLDSSGGYRWLDSYVMAGIIQLATLDFCERFLNLRNDPCGRQFDQMTQAARSGKMNIIEGSERAATSKETEMKLTDVAKASLGELRGDYETWLLRRRSLPWRRDSHEAQEIFSFRLDKPQYGDDVAYDSVAHLLQQSRRLSAWLEHEDSLVVARALIILIGRTINMLEHQVKWQHQRFVQEGGFREQLSPASGSAQPAAERAFLPALR